MSVNHHELRRACQRFLAAKRALHLAYLKSGASHCSAEPIPILESTDHKSGNDSLRIEELEELKDENQKLRKSLALLHRYSLRVQEQRDALVAHRNMLLEVCEAIAPLMRDHDRSDDCFMAALEQLEGVIGELSNSSYSCV